MASFTGHVLEYAGIKKDCDFVNESPRTTCVVTVVATDVADRSHVLHVQCSSSMSCKTGDNVAIRVMEVHVLACNLTL